MRHFMVPNTFPQVRLIPGAVSDLFAQASSSGKVTIADRYGLMAAVLEEELSEDERMSIDRILYALNRGRVQVVDEISCVGFGLRNLS
jgi:hypothetical protein